MRKEKEKKILPTLKFMLKTAVKNKPQLFIAYVLQVVVSFSQTMVNIISSKYLVDEIAAIIGGGNQRQSSQINDKFFAFADNLMRITFRTDRNIGHRRFRGNDAGPGGCHDIGIFDRSAGD